MKTMYWIIGILFFIVIIISYLCITNYMKSNDNNYIQINQVADDNIKLIHELNKKIDSIAFKIKTINDTVSILNNEIKLNKTYYLKEQTKLKYEFDSKLDSIRTIYIKIPIDTL